MQTHLFSCVLLAGARRSSKTEACLLRPSCRSSKQEALFCRPRAGRVTCSAGSPRGGFGVLSAAFFVRRGLVELAWRGWSSVTFSRQRGADEARRESLGTG
ncbi:hypothetical protein BDA96_05G032700 [Sorghum bicolor]|uniref:Uncharacterized protein n=2 Tax=Sorghum bicolor TaxID=4558 RepID=A0A921QWX1_SORBI|nr:hypothetical protein BDA96_09G149400 [Sorghum bicolor]KAG0528680.1 hypothetical protein BDA96_05G032700 [Sorghum bicolor]KXG22028.1 hypothetical protein SORBI_3009G141900 [Sorghum bicolor]